MKALKNIPIMNTLLDEMLELKRSTKNKHQLDCYCRKCKARKMSDVYYSRLNNESFSGHSNDILNEIKITSSCEPGKFKRNRLSVTWWGKRTKIPRIIPSNIDLAILSRGRIRIAVEKIKWLIRKYQSKDNWLGKLPSNLSKNLPEADVTFELFINQHNLDENGIENSLKSYLANRHQKELVDCEKGYYILHIEPAVKSQIIEDLTGVDLRRLFIKANVPTPNKIKAYEKRKYWLLTYVSIPNQLEDILLPGPQPQPKPVPNIVPLSDRELRELALSLTDGKQKTNGSVSRIYKMAKTIAKKMKGSRPGLGILIEFLKEYYKATVRQFKRNPKKELSVIMGSVYAIMDSATGVKRPYVQSKFRRRGYLSMKKRIIAIEVLPGVSGKHRKIMKRLAAVPSKKRAIGIMFRAIIKIDKIDSDLGAWAINAKRCRFRYPAMKSDCGRFHI